MIKKKSMSLLNSLLEPSLPTPLPSVKATLNYLLPMAEKPVTYTYDPPPGIPRQSGQSVGVQVPIYNARMIANDLSLDREGFALIEQFSAVQNFYDSEEVHRVYYPEVESLLKAFTDASRVVFFDPMVRNSRQLQLGQTDIKGPIHRIHNDFTANSGYIHRQRELEKIGEPAPEALLGQRFSIINIWRSIAGLIQESPLAVCNAQTIALSDWVANDLVYRDRVSEVYSLTYNAAHQWFYFPKMHWHEVLLIKCFDSDDQGRARFTAHTAFHDPTSTSDAPARESIELRALVFY